MKYSVKAVLSEGYIYGPILKIKLNKLNNSSTSIDLEKNKIRKSIKLSLEELDSIGNKSSDLESYISVQKLMISDYTLLKAIDKKIEEGLSAIDALNLVIENLEEPLKNSNSLYLQARTNDFEDTLHRLENNLEEHKTLETNNKYILVTEKLYPSLLIEHRANLLGIVAREGGYSSHSAIIARGLDIPFVIIDEDISCASLIIDTRKEELVTDPSKEAIDAFYKDYKERSAFEKKAIPHPGYSFYANVQSNRDVEKAFDYGFDGVGLYRTEMIFMNLDRPYTMEEQAKIYLEAAEIMKDKSICFRTFDVGDDKKLSYLNCNKKSIDNYIYNKKIFEDQIEAMLQANINNNVSIMFPMIESEDEFSYLKNWVLQIQEAKGYNKPSIGMMLESEKALKNINDFTDTDFISVGTNDLSKALYKVDRESGIDPEAYARDLINKLKPVVEFCNKNNIKLSVCGELAAIKKDALRFYDIGLKNLSVNPSCIRMLNSVYTEFMNNNK